MLMTASLASAQSVKVSDQDQAQIEKNAERVGRAMLQQGHSQSDIQKLVETYVRNEFAQVVDPANPEAPLSPRFDADVQATTFQVLKALKINQPLPKPPVVTPGPSPFRPAVNPDPAPPIQPAKPPVAITPSHVQLPVYPVLPVINYHKTSYGWMILPDGQSPLGFSPFQGVPFATQPPVIHIRRGWFGHPDQVRYSYGFMLESRN